MPFLMEMHSDSKIPRILYLFTLDYPFGNQETFIENEIQVLAERFESVKLIPLLYIGDLAIQRAVPDNVEIVQDFLGLFEKFTDNPPRKSQHIWDQLKMAWWERKKQGRPWSDVRYSLSQFRYHLEIADILNLWLDRQGIAAKNAHFYTYWFSDWATILSILKSRKEIPDFTSRAHGYDLYPERNTRGYIPHRWFQLKQAKQVFPVSKFGTQFLQQAFPEFQQKVKTGYLGVNDHGLGKLPQNKETLSIISVANLVPVKRIHLIAGMLKHVSMPIRWTHFGDGPEVARIKEALPKDLGQVEVCWKGRRPNHEVLSFLKSEPLHMFLNVSESEGLPVSLMEAISFGVPVLATNVGGVAEIVNSQTGKLLSADIDEKSLAEEVEAFSHSWNWSNTTQASVRSFWQTHFNASLNYHHFCDLLITS